MRHLRMWRSIWCRCLKKARSYSQKKSSWREKRGGAGEGAACGVCVGRGGGQRCGPCACVLVWLAGSGGLQCGQAASSVVQTVRLPQNTAAGRPPAPPLLHSPHCPGRWRGRAQPASSGQKKSRPHLALPELWREGREVPGLHRVPPQLDALHVLHLHPAGRAQRAQRPGRLLSPRAASAEAAAQAPAAVVECHQPGARLLPCPALPIIQ